MAAAIANFTAASIMPPQALLRRPAAPVIAAAPAPDPPTVEPQTRVPAMQGRGSYPRRASAVAGALARDYGVPISIPGMLRGGAPGRGRGRGRGRGGSLPVAAAASPDSALIQVDDDSSSDSDMPTKKRKAAGSMSSSSVSSGLDEDH